MLSAHAVVLPTFDDLARAQKLVKIQEEHETLKDAMAQWIMTIRAFVAVAETKNFTDRNGHALELNPAFVELKDSVSE